MTLVCVMALGCGSPSSAEPAPAAEPESGAGGEAPDRASDADAPDEAARALCAQVELEEGSERTSCALRPDGLDLRGGARLEVLEIGSEDDQGGQYLELYLVFRGAPAEPPRHVERLCGGYDRGNGDEWSECAFRAVERTDEGVSVSFDVIDVTRACSGDPSCFDDDSNLTRVPYPHRTICTNEEGAYTCEREER